MKKRRASRAQKSFRYIFLLAILMFAGGFFAIQRSTTSAATTHNLVKYPKSKMTRITLKKVLSAKRPQGMGSLQGFTMTDKYFVMILRPPGQEDNNRVEIIRRSDNANVSKSFKYPKFNMGHGNDATWNSKTNEIVVADGSRKQLFRMSATTFKKTGTTKLVNSKGTALSASGIAYDKARNIYYAASGSSIRTFNTSNKLVSSFTELHNQTNQGFAYNNGYLYRPTWESAGTYKNATYDKIFKKNTTVLYQFGLDGSFTHAYYIDNPLYEVESMAFDENNVPYIAFNGPSGYYAIYKVTDANLLKQLRQSYTISYYDNGGSGSPKDQTAYVGTAKTLSKTKPTRSGYNFLGWSTSKTATKASYAAGASFLKAYGQKNTNVKLYAVWGQSVYYVAYNANGGSGAPGTQTITSNQNAIISTTKPTRANYTFLGWATKATATAAEYQPGATYTARKSITFYAVWKANTYTITYNANGGLGAPNAQTATAGQAVTLSAVKPTRTGYNFLGWATSQTATSAQYVAGAKYTGSSNVTLYAVWQLIRTPDQKITVSYDANGGANAPTATTGIVGEVILSTAKPTRTGYNFLGWATKATATSAEYQPGATYTGKSSITLYAVWQQVLTISFDANGGTNAPAAQKVVYGRDFTLTAAKPTRSGYTFLGWSIDKNAESATYLSGYKYNLHNNLNLYAVWAKVEKVIKFDGNGGNENMPLPISTEDGDIVLPTTRPLRSGGWGFIGWSTDKNATVPQYQPGDRIQSKDADGITLYAVWAEVADSVIFEEEKYDSDEEDENINDASDENGGEDDDIFIPSNDEDVEELPQTGPAEVAVVVIALICLASGVTYWYMSSRQLKNLQHAVRGHSAKKTRRTRGNRKTQE